jgi:hypothetical protein
MIKSGHNFDNLQRHILSLSEAKNFFDARKEWNIKEVEILEDFDKCPCGQPIKERCHIENDINKNKTYVGNICINQLLGISTNNLFEGLKRIIEDSQANPNEDLIVHARSRGYIHPREYQFLIEMKRKRKKSFKQIQWIQKINHRIRNKIIVATPYEIVNQQEAFNTTGTDNILEITKEYPTKQTLLP